MTGAAQQRRAPGRGAEHGDEGVGFDVDDAENTTGSWEVYQVDKGAALAARSEEGGGRGGGGASVGRRAALVAKLDGADELPLAANAFWARASEVVTL